MSKREIVDIDDLKLDPEDYKKYNGRRLVMSKGKVVIIMSNHDYNFINIVMDKEYTRFIHKDGNDFNFEKSNIIKKPTKINIKNAKIRICPDCNIEILKDRKRYCTVCGCKRIYNRTRRK